MLFSEENSEQGLSAGRMGIVPKVWRCKLKLTRTERDGEKTRLQIVKRSNGVRMAKGLSSPLVPQNGDSFAISVAEL